MLYILIAFLSASLSSAQIYFKAHCPNVSGMKNFNFSAFASGLWYEVARYPNVWEGRGDCASLEFSPEDKRTKFRINDITDSQRLHFDGYIEDASESNNTGVVVYYSKTFVDEEGGEAIPVYILGTDYNSFIVSYECKYDEETKMRHDYAWVGSRSMTLDIDTKKRIDSILETGVIDRNKLIWDRFTKEACDVKK